MADKFGHSTTGAEVAALFGENASDKHILITGANCGLGYATAELLAGYKAHIIVACRSQKSADETAERIKKAIPSADVVGLELDLSNLSSVSKAVETYKSLDRPLHILINNAGVMACPKSLTVDGFETQFGVNHVGHFAFTQGLIPVLAKTGTKEQPARIVNLASLANYLFGPQEGIIFDDLEGNVNYDAWERYGQSKLANILFTKELQKRYGDQNIVSVSLHPGSITQTNLMRHLGFGFVWSLLKNMFQRPSAIVAASSDKKNLAQGIATTILAALTPEPVPGGYYANCQIEKYYVHARADDAELATKLWEVTEQLLAKAGKQ
eukprot:Colp12_sorted_trinity150504_noHs@26113